MVRLLAALRNNHSTGFHNVDGKAAHGPSKKPQDYGGNPDHATLGLVRVRLWLDYGEVRADLCSRQSVCLQGFSIFSSSFPGQVTFGLPRPLLIRKIGCLCTNSTSIPQSKTADCRLGQFSPYAVNILHKY